MSAMRSTDGHHLLVPSERGSDAAAAEERDTETRQADADAETWTVGELIEYLGTF